MIPLFTTAGQPVAFADEACQALYDATGSVLAWFDKDLLYAPNGRYLGWVQQGWVYDRHGRPALFAENACGGPHRPAVHPEKVALPRRLRLAARPAAFPRQPRPARRARTREWSPYSAAAYFCQ